MNITVNEVYSYLLEAFEELDKILDSEKEALLKNNGEEILKIVDKKTIVIKKISLLEEKRILLTNDMKVKELISKEYVTKDTIDKLKALTKSIQYKNETNGMLTKQSLHYIRAIKFALTPNENRVTTYGNKGEIGEKTSDSIFSTKL